MNDSQTLNECRADNDNSKRKPFWRSWRIWLIATTISLVVAGVAGWLVVDGFLKSNFESRLVDLDMGFPTVGSLSLSPLGVNAHDIRFYRSRDDPDPWLTVDELVIKHSLTDLIAGADHYDEIELVGVQVVIDLDEANSERGTAILDSSDMPADTIRIQRSTITFRQVGKDDFVADQINATIAGEEEISINGEIGEMTGGPWEISGRWHPRRSEVHLGLKTDHVVLNTDQWSRWPLAPSEIGKSFTADGTAQVSLNVSITPDDGALARGELVVNSIDLNLPDPGLPIQLREGTIRFDHNRIGYQDIKATLPDGGTLTVTGETKTKTWPFKTVFEGQFSKVETGTWRKLVTGIPNVLNATTDGTIRGKILIDKTKSVSVTIDANAIAPGGSYSDIVAERIDASVEVKQLKFNEAFQFESIDGRVNVWAEIANQDVSNLFNTFDLSELQSQMAISGRGLAHLEMSLPLASIGDVKTWTINVDANITDGEFGKQPVEDAELAAKLVDGSLVLDPIRIRTRPETANLPNARYNAESGHADQPDLTAFIRWPLVEDAVNSSYGEVVVTTAGTSPEWVTRALRHLVRNSRESDVDGISTLMAQLDGSLNARLELTVPVLMPNALSNWNGVVQIEDSALSIAGVSFRNLTGQLSLSNTQILFQEMTANGSDFNTLVLDGYWNIDRPDQYKMSLDVRSLNVNGMTNMYRNLVETGVARETGLDSAVPSAVWSFVDGELAGDLDLEVELTGGIGDHNDASRHGWQLELTAQSRAIRIRDTGPVNLDVQLKANEKLLHVSQFLAELREGGRLNGQGKWDFRDGAGSGSLEWDQLPVRPILPLTDLEKSMDFNFSPGMSQGMITVQSDNDGEFPMKIEGRVGISGLEFGELGISQITFNLATRGDSLVLNEFRSDDRTLDLDLNANIKLDEPYEFEIQGNTNGLALSRFFEPAQTGSIQKRPNLKGAIDGVFRFAGTLSPLDWRSNGRLTVSSPSVNDRSIADILVEWDHFGDDWTQSKLRVDAFGGSISTVDLARQPSRVLVEFSDIDAEQLSILFQFPNSIAGKLSGRASLNEWSFPDSRWAEIHLRSPSLEMGNVELDDLAAEAEYRNRRVEYAIDGKLFEGKLAGYGQSELHLDQLRQGRFPLLLTLTNATLSGLFGESDSFRFLHPLEGTLSATMDVVFPWNEYPNGSGRIAVYGLKWGRELLTHEASLKLIIDEERAVFDDIKIDLKRGSVTAKASLPINGESGFYEVDVRRLDLQRAIEILFGEASAAEGQLNARFAGNFGQFVTGYGYAGLDWAKLRGLSGQSERIPFRYHLSLANQAGRIELQHSRFRFLDGNVSGKASLEFGQSTDLDIDLDLVNVNSGELIDSLLDVGDLNQGRLNGTLQLSGRNIHSTRDLDGTFVGQFDRLRALRLPVLDQIGRFLSPSTGNIVNQVYDSDEFDLRLNDGRIEVRRMAMHSSLAEIYISGFAHLDGRLDLAVAARVERLNQPSLIEELSGSSPGLLRSSPAAFYARAADFLSDRIVYLQVQGTIERPRIRLDSARQLPEEAIRYFFRDSQLLPFQTNR